jgi:MFS transporter, DHA1 family, inner membrane transport protein
MAAPAHRTSLWVLLLGNFIIGTGVLLPSGLLNDISADFSITPAKAGLLMLAGGLVVAIGAPLMAGLTSGIERRKILTLALAIYGTGHLAAALAPTFELQILLRMLTVVGATIFTPQAAATAGLMVPQSERAAAIAFIFIGWSLASVAGIPLGGYLATVLGWRGVFAGMGLLCLAAGLAVWRSIPARMFVAPLGLAAWTQAFTSPLILLVLFVTLLSMAGQFTLLTYVAPIIAQGFHGGPGQISLAFALWGIFGVCGNALASRIVGTVGIDRVIGLAIGFMIAGTGLFAAGFGAYWLALASFALWGLGSFASNSLQQSRLVALAPHLASATVALNTSVVFMGQSTGAAVGGWFINRGVDASMGWCACVLVTCALAVSVLATRMGAAPSNRQLAG